MGVLAAVRPSVRPFVWLLLTTDPVWRIVSIQRMLHHPPTLRLTITTRRVSHPGLAIYIKKYLKEKEKLN